MSHHTEMLSKPGPAELLAQAHELLQREAGLPLLKRDVFARLFFAQVDVAVRNWPGRTAATVSVPSTQGPLEKIDVVPDHISIPIEDEDDGPLSATLKFLFNSLCALPRVDDERQWPSHVQAMESIATYLEPLLPESLNHWAETTSDKAMELLAFQGLAAHRLQPLDGDPEGAAYVVDLAWMSGLRVREGIEPYGATAYFGPDRKLRRIYTPHDDMTRRPGDAGWSDAKWRWRCSLVAVVTVADHLGGVHLAASNVMNAVTREHLPAAHPLRRLLTPHIFGAVTINSNAAYSLACKGGIADRLFGFEFPDLAKLIVAGVEHLSFEPFPKTIAAKRVDALGDLYPYATDGLAFHAIVRRYVGDYLAVFFPGETAVVDPAVRDWWRALLQQLPGSGLLPLTRTAQLVDLVTQYILIVTAMHQHVGGVAAYLRDPAFFSPKILQGHEVSDIQSTYIALSLIAFTGIDQPRLMDDWTHVFPDEKKDQTSAIFEAFRKSLEALCVDIDRRNVSRDQPFRVFYPSILDSSVST